ncbi:MAG: ISAs1 family transposase [Planctomycetes bacterium]|nr:ISAs1 family transposase [Planctomycetota bacterium]
MSQTRFTMDEVLCHFEELEDPRSEINRKHPLVSVVVIAILGVLAQANGPTAIAGWARIHAEFLKGLLPLPHGIPGKDVFRRVLCALKPEVFQQCFANWIQTLRQDAAEATGVDEPTFAVDGKTLRRSHDAKKGLGPLHSVSVWASEYGITLAQVATDEKSNEITAIPQVLRLVDLKGAIITIDAMGTQKAIAKQIVEGGGNYVLALKKNQEKLHDAVVDYVIEQMDNDFADIKVRRQTTEEKGHGRLEKREYIQMPAPTTLPGFENWQGLATIGLVILTCLRNGKETTELRFFISSLPLGVKRFAKAVRNHWGIENTCHWSLDVTYREDESRIRDVNARENMAWLNRFTLSLLKQHPGKGSLIMKRRSCGWSPHFMLEVLAAQQS